jgi:hypothetical protein
LHPVGGCKTVNVSPHAAASNVRRCP